MARQKKIPFLVKFSIIGGILVVVQLVVIYTHSSEPSLTAREAIEKAATQQTNISPERKVQLKVQLALTDYMMTNQNQPPATLDLLVPKYFDTVPLDPTTNEPIQYQVVKGVPYVGKAPSSTKGTGTHKVDLANLSETEKEKELLIASLQEDPLTKEDYVYDPTGKKDPFLPFNMAPDIEDPTKSPLERYDVGQLKLTAVLAGIDEPTAMVENQAGIGFNVKKGTKIGTTGGEVVDILPDRILILETSVDFTGKLNSRTVEMKLRTKDQTEAGN